MSGTTTDIHVAATGSIDHAPSANTPAPEGTEGQEAAAPREPTARELAMQAIVARAEEQRNRELAYGEELGEDARERAAADETPEETGPEAQPDPAVARAATTVKDAVAPPAPAAPKEPERHLITVGGQQFQVTADELRQLAEMGAVANIALRQHQGEPQQQAPQVQAPPRQQQAAPAPRGLDDEAAKALHHRLTYGSETEAVQAIKDLYAAAAASAPPAVDPNAIARAATQGALQQISLNTNLNIISQEYPQVFADEGTSQLAALKLHKIRQRDSLLGVQKPDLEAYREACRAVLDDARRLAGGAPLQPGQGAASTPVQAAAGRSFEDRDARKRAAPKTPTAASRKASMGDDRPRAPSGSEIVEQMRRARHQASMR